MERNRKPNPALVAALTLEGYDPDTTTYWTNDRYQVIARIVADGSMVHLSIKRHDRKALHDWRHLQQIKNEVVGYGCEAVELYPADERVLDEANQYHLWVWRDPTFRLPFGSPDRLVSGPEEAAAVGARQRPFEEGLG
jgi:hypothetical protein